MGDLPQAFSLDGACSQVQEGDLEVVSHHRKWSCPLRPQVIRVEAGSEVPGPA